MNVETIHARCRVLAGAVLQGIERNDLARVEEDLRLLWAYLAVALEGAARATTPADELRREELAALASVIEDLQTHLHWLRETARLRAESVQDIVPLLEHLARRRELPASTLPVC